MHSVTLDLITGLPPVAESDATQIVVLVDRFFKKVFTKSALSTLTGPQLAEKLYRDEFWEHGMPMEVILDQDAKFVSGLWSELFKATGTKLSMSYAYHQRFDDQTEVANRVLEVVLRTRLNFKQDNYERHPLEITSAVNNSINPTTGLSPNQVYYGRRLFTPVQIKYGLSSAEPSGTFLDDMMAFRARATVFVRASTTDTVLRHHNKTRHRKVYGMGMEDFVIIEASFLTRPGHRNRPSRKLRNRREEPFEIIEVVSATDRKLRLPKSWRHHPTIYVKNLTPNKIKEEKVSPEPDLYGDDGAAFYKVESLEARALSRSTLKYFVKYVGYGIDDGCWVARSVVTEDRRDQGMSAAGGVLHIRHLWLVARAPASAAAGLGSHTPGCCICVAILWP